MAEFAQQLEDWSSGDARREDQAARSLHEQYVHRLGKSLAGSLDMDEIDELEASAKAMFKTARESMAQRSSGKRPRDQAFSKSASSGCLSI